MKNNFKNLSDLIFYQAKKFENKQFLNFKKDGEWQNFSNFEFLEKSIYFALALQEKGFRKGDKLAIYAYQNPYWLIADFATILAGGVTVPIFHNICQENLFFQLKDADVNTIFADFNDDFEEKNHFNKLETLLSKECSSVKNIISSVLGHVWIKTDVFSTISSKKGLKADILYLEKFLKIGENCLKAKNIRNLRQLLKEDLEVIYEKLGFSSPNEKDLTTIVYTSGSTGNPKGVELSHENLVSQIQDAGKCFGFNEGDKILSFLPLAHIFERMVMMLYISRGVSVFFVDDVKNLGGFLKEIKPNVMTVVPRMLEKVFAKIKNKSQNSGFLTRKLALNAINQALAKDVLAKKSWLDCVFNKIVYQKYRDALGGEMRMMICGGAALSGEMERFFRNIGVNLYCGYGLTETSPVLAVNFVNNYKFGSVGKKFDSVELKIAEDGELLAKGKNIMLGYRNQKGKTAEVMEGDWLKTGDLAKIDDEGFLTIIGRKKELFKTSNGKYVRPIPIEQKLVQDLGFLTGALIIAEAKNFVSALIFPDFELIEPLKNKFSFSGDDKDFLKSKDLNEFVSEKIAKINETLDRGEQIFKFKIIEDQISIASGDVTPSMKLRRISLEAKYQKEIGGMYR